MNHKQKTLILKVLSRLPRSLGDALYHKLQKRRSLTDLPAIYQAQSKSYDKFASVLERHNIDLKDKTVLEIGSGWLPGFPYFLLYKSGCKEVWTYDLNTHFQADNISKLNDLFRTENPEIELKTEGKYNIPTAVKYFPSTDLTAEPPPEGKIDLVISRFVLEHVTPQDLIGIHEGAYKWLKDDGYIFHHVSPSDHRAYTDKSLSLYDFLQYSQAEWDKIQTRFDYHNRLRLPHYIDIFEQSGWDIVYERHSGLAPEQVDKFRKLKLHDDYQSLSEEEQTAGSLIFLLKKKSI